MAKFNQPPAPPVHDTLTHEGGAGFTRPAKVELFLLGVANTVGEDTFYESGETRDKRFVDLVREVTAEDPRWVREFGAWLRAEGLMRSASIVLAAEYVAAGGPDARGLVAAVCQRPDEPAEFLAYWHATHGRKLPMAVKRGLADAVRRLYTERSFLRYDGSGKAYRWADVIELVHPDPVAEWQSWLFKYAIDVRHNRDNPRLSIPHLPHLARDRELLRLPAESRRAALLAAVANGWSWERLAGWLPGGMNAAAWEAIEPNMGLMALTRNLRNFDQAQVSNAFISRVTARFGDADEVRRSRQFPIRFLTAWRALRSTHWALALEWAIEQSTVNLPRFGGRTLILIDVSPSMTDVLFSARKGKDSASTPKRYEAAAVFGLALAKAAERADVGLFDFDCERYPFQSQDSILRSMEYIQARTVRGNGTDTLGALASTYAGHDRVVILTDEQTGRGAPCYHGHTSHHGYGTVGDPAAWEELQRRIKVPVISFNLGGYAAGHAPEFGNWHAIGGLSDGGFAMIENLERHTRGVWPWHIHAKSTGAPEGPDDEDAVP